MQTELKEFQQYIDDYLAEVSPLVPYYNKFDGPKAITDPMSAFDLGVWTTLTKVRIEFCRFEDYMEEDNENIK